MSGAVQPLLGYGGAAPSNPLNLFISQDYIVAGGSNGVGVFLSQLMTTPQKTDWQNGVYNILNLSASGSPGRGYWVVSGAAGAGGTTPGEQGGNGGVAFNLDLDPGVPVTLNLDSHLIHFYGGPGGGGGSNTVLFGGGGNGGAAISIGFMRQIDINITNQSGATIGVTAGGGGGGGAGSAGGNPQFPGSGGGGAGGWFAGIAGVASGGLSNSQGSNGGIYDTNNGGTGNINVTGGAGGGGFAGTGGALGANGTGATGGGGTGGFAVNRNGATGTTTVINGSSGIKGTVQ